MSNWTELSDGVAAMDPPEAVLTRLQKLLSYYEALGFDRFETFVSEATEDDGTRKFNSLWLFNQVATMEAVLSEGEGDQLDGARIRSHLQRWALKSQKYDFVTAEPESRLNVQLWYSDDLWGELSATGANCDRLRDLLRRYVVTETGVPAPAEAS